MYQVVETESAVKCRKQAGVYGSQSNWISARLHLKLSAPSQRINNVQHKTSKGAMYSVGGVRSNEVHVCMTRPSKTCKYGDNTIH